MKSTDVLISGGGIPGLTLGILLAEAGLSVALCDPSPVLSPDKIRTSGKTAALMQSSLDILAHAGLLEKIELLCEDLNTLSILDGASDITEKLDFHSREIGQERFGKNIPNDLLLAFAAERFLGLENAVFIGERATGFERQGNAVIAELSNGEFLSCKLLVGADGRNSPVREFAGISVSEHDYNQMALTGVLRHEKNHRQASTEFHYPGGPFTIVPMKDNQSSFVWMEKTEDAKKYQQLAKQDIEAELQRRSKDLVGAVELASDLSAYPIKVQKSKNLVAHRIALIAEAAHVISPIGAQGLNLSLRDVASLANTIIQAARNGIDFGSDITLARYEKERFMDISLRVAGTDVLNRSVATENLLFKGLRKTGLKAAAHITPLKHLLIREAWSPRTSLAQEILSGFETRATVNTSTLEAPAS